jgi:hypothetical protein
MIIIKMMVIFCNIFPVASNTNLSRLGFDYVTIHAWEQHAYQWPNCILFLYHKFNLTKPEINNTKFVGLEVSNSKIGFKSSTLYSLSEYKDEKPTVIPGSDCYASFLYEKF